MEIDGLSQKFSMPSTEDTSSEKLVEKASTISIIFENTTGNRVDLSHLRFRGKSLNPDRVELAGGESRVFEVSFPLENRNDFQEITFSSLVFSGSNAAGNSHSLSLDFSQNSNMTIQMKGYHEPLYGEKGHYCGIVLYRVAAVLKG